MSSYLEDVLKGAWKAGFEAGKKRKGKKKVSKGRAVCEKCEAEAITNKFLERVRPQEIKGIANGTVNDLMAACLRQARRIILLEQRHPDAHTPWGKLNNKDIYHFADKFGFEDVRYMNEIARYIESIVKERNHD